MIADKANGRGVEIGDRDDVIVADTAVERSGRVGVTDAEELKWPKDRQWACGKLTYWASVELMPSR